jgi:hypothetical protein
MTVTSASAFAWHGSRPKPVTVQGLIMSVTSSQMQLKTANGTTTVALEKGVTQIVRMVNGSTGDVTTGRVVHLHLIHGTHTADTIRVELAGHLSHRSVGHGVSKSGRHLSSHAVENVAPIGLVTAFSGGTLTVQYANGSTGAYSVAQNVTVTEALSGTFNDLGMGETVQAVIRKPGAPASTVIITNA